eukprot:456773_1
MLPNKLSNQPRPPINVFDAVFDFSDLSSDVQTHLTKVYRLLSLVIITSILGAAIQIKYFLLTQFIFPYILCLLAIMISIACIPKDRFFIRIGLAMLFGLFQGIIIGPLVNEAIDIDPQIVRAAFILTLCVFVSFSLMAMMTKNKKYLYLGSMLNSFCLFLLFMNIFPTSFGYQLSLYGGLIMFIGYVFYDTQQIIKRVEKYGLENTDYVSDAITLYIDFVAIFVRILILIMRAKQRGEGGSSNNSKPTISTRNIKIDL